MRAGPDRLLAAEWARVAARAAVSGYIVFVIFRDTTPYRTETSVEHAPREGSARGAGWTTSLSEARSTPDRGRASRLAVEDEPAQLVAQPLVVEHEFSDSVGKLSALPLALQAPSVDTLVFGGRRPGCLDRIGGGTELVGRNVGDRRGLASGVGSVSRSSGQLSRRGARRACSARASGSAGRRRLPGGSGSGGRADHPPGGGPRSGASCDAREAPEASGRAGRGDRDAPQGRSDPDHVSALAEASGRGRRRALSAFLTSGAGSDTIGQ